MTTTVVDPLVPLPHSLRIVVLVLGLVVATAAFGAAVTPL